jgi:hypothetical protein
MDGGLQLFLQFIRQRESDRNRPNHYRVLLIKNLQYRFEQQNKIRPIVTKSCREKIRIKEKVNKLHGVTFGNVVA